MSILPFNWTKALQEVSQIKIKSITDPVFKFALIALAIGAGSVAFVPVWASVFIFSASGLLFLLGIGFYWYFAIKDPNYLRSETFQLHMKSIEHMGDKNNLLSASKIIELDDTADTTDSPAKQIDDKQEENG